MRYEHESNELNPSLPAVFEYVSDPTTFAQKLFEVADVVVISVPYKWPKGTIKGHTHDPVDEMKLREWTGRVPVDSRIVDRPARLVAVYGAS